MSAGDWKDLFQAASKGDYVTVKYHLDNGVDPNYQHPEILSTPLVAAIANGHSQIAELLLNSGAHPQLVSILDNMNAFEAAHRSNQTEILNLLRQNFEEPKVGFFSLAIKKINFMFKF